MDTKVVMIFDTKGKPIIETCTGIYKGKDGVDNRQEMIHSFVACTERFCKTLAVIAKLPNPNAFEVSNMWEVMEKTGYTARVCEIKVNNVEEPICAETLAKEIMGKLTHEQVKEVKQAAYEVMKGDKVARSDQNAADAPKRFKGGVDRFTVNPSDVGL